ncbi:MAG TPA: glycoside hydrolase family 3 C-terminal domain-containing protein [Euzebyales bacterium]|nr:glycoside hydrolase family 3 C-terminal domain-containing protein [Euzebyales bacterium]
MTEQASSARDVEALVAELTLDEKALLCSGSDMWHTAAVERLGVPRIMVSDGPHGLRAQVNDAGDISLSASAPATCFPTAAGLASSWNPALFAEVGAALAVEARGVGVSVLLGPGINIKRSPLCGRNFEYVAEDPWLAGELATAMVQGVQRGGVGTSLKHFAANNQEHDRMRVSAEVDERTLREVYLPAFERVVTGARPWTVMCSYNRINGTHASEHRWLLTEVLREQWGFEGLVVSDWGAVHDRVAALRAGLDLEMPPHLGVSDAAVVEAVRSGALNEAVLDASVRRVLDLVYRSQSALREHVEVDVDAHHALARRAAHESAVLLRNDRGVLPLRPVAGETLAVIGEFARTPRYQGAGSSHVNPTRIDVALDELTVGVGPGVDVRFAAGFRVDDTDDAALRDEAVALARDADHVVVFLGLPAVDESEGYDRSDMDLPATQVALLRSVAAVHDRAVVVLANGSAVKVSDWDGDVAAILECWLSGQAAGGAAADLLLGLANPSGKLAETIPLRLEDNSAYLNFPGDRGVVRYGEGVFVGYRGHDALDQRVSYPFGFGLSYTTFEIDDIDVAVSGSVADGDLDVEVSATVTNTGGVAGGEVVQVYVGDVEASVARPVRELKGAAKVWLEPGERRRVTISLDQRAFAFWSVQLGRWAVEAGDFVIEVGSSSRDLGAAETITLDAPSIAGPLTPRSTLHEWLADPQGREVLATVGDGDSPLHDDDLLAMIGAMPMETLAVFPDTGFTKQMLDEWLARLQSA